MIEFRDMRYACSIPLRVHVNNAPREVEITGFSQTGARVRADAEWEVGDDVLLPLRLPALRGKVVRTADDEAGVKFLIRLSGSEIMALRGTEGCRPVPPVELRR